MCTAAGQDASGKAILYTSTDGGANWDLAKAETADDSSYVGTACTNHGAQIACIVVGGICESFSSDVPFLYVNTNAVAGSWVSPLTLSDGFFIGAGASGNSSGEVFCSGQSSEEGDCVVKIDDEE